MASTGMFGVCASIMRGVARPGRADRGLYGGKRIVFGKKLAPHKKTPKSTTRTFQPNVVKKKFFSPILDRTMAIRVTTHTMRCIDKAGGFDEYILNTKSHKLDSELGFKLKAEMKDVLATQPE